MARGYQRQQAALRERDLDKWRRWRISTVIQLNANRGDNDSALTPEEFMPLPGDAPPEPVSVMSEEEFDRIAARFQS